MTQTLTVRLAGKDVPCTLVDRRLSRAIVRIHEPVTLTIPKSVTFPAWSNIDVSASRVFVQVS